MYERCTKVRNQIRSENLLFFSLFLLVFLHVHLYLVGVSSLTRKESNDLKMVKEWAKSVGP